MRDVSEKASVRSSFRRRGLTLAYVTYLYDNIYLAGKLYSR